MHLLGDCFGQTSIVEPTVVWLLFQSQKIGLNSKFNDVICICAPSEQSCILTPSQHLFYAL